MDALDKNDYEIVQPFQIYDTPEVGLCVLYNKQFPYYSSQASW